MSTRMTCQSNDKNSMKLSRLWQRKSLPEKSPSKYYAIVSSGNWHRSCLGMELAPPATCVPNQKPCQIKNRAIVSSDIAMQEPCRSKNRAICDLAWNLQGSNLALNLQGGGMQETCHRKNPTHPPSTSVYTRNTHTQSRNPETGSIFWS